MAFRRTEQRGRAGRQSHHRRSTTMRCRSPSDFGGMYGPSRPPARVRAAPRSRICSRRSDLDYRYVGAGNDVAALVAALRGRDAISIVRWWSISTPPKGAGYDGEETHADRQTASAAPVSFDSATGVHPTDDANHSEPWHSDHCNLSDHEPHEGQCEASHWQDPDSAQSASRSIARKHYGQNGDGRAGVRVSPPSRDWWSSPPPRRARTASPVSSVSARRIASCGHGHHRGACGGVRRRHRDGRVARPVVATSAPRSSSARTTSCCQETER